jgi:hypothetical protein
MPTAMTTMVTWSSNNRERLLRNGVIPFRHRTMRGAA